MKKTYTHEPVSLYLFDPKYRENATQVLYTGTAKLDEYNAMETRKDVLVVDHSEYRHSEMNFNRIECNDELFKFGTEFYAYGLMFNTSYTNLIPLDFDLCVGESMTKQACDIVWNHDHILGADVIQTSSNGFHIYLALDRAYNVGMFLNGIPNLCRGYKSCASSRSDVTIRVSQKFRKNSEDCTLVPQFMIRKTEKELFLHCGDNIIYPISSIRKTIQEDNPVRKKTIKLRG